MLEVFPTKNRNMQNCVYELVKKNMHIAHTISVTQLLYFVTIDLSEYVQPLRLGRCSGYPADWISGCITSHFSIWYPAGFRILQLDVGRPKISYFLVFTMKIKKVI